MGNTCHHLMGDDTTAKTMRIEVGPRLEGHWLDSFGAAYSVPAATGVVAGDSLILDFPYPSGAFHDSFVYDAAADTWTIPDVAVGPAVGSALRST